MNTSILQQLKAHLASISAEQFRAEWGEIEAMGLGGGPSAKDFLQSLGNTSTVSPIDHLQLYNTLISEAFTSVPGNFTYAMAA